MKFYKFSWNSKSTNMLGVTTFIIVLNSFFPQANFQQILTRSNLSETDILLNPINLKQLKSKIYGQPSFEVGRLLKQLRNAKQNPEELGTYFEGDILHPIMLQRNGLTNQSLRWKNGVVPVELRGEFNSNELKLINTAFEIYHNNTCIKFVQHSNENDYITITKKTTGCWSSLGRIGGPQTLNLQSPMCLYKVGTPLHELMHVLGFNHEHTREDRDGYVEIDWKNIPIEAYANFGKALPNATNTFGVEYDYESVLHYSAYAFAMDSTKTTIKALNHIRSKKMGQRDRLSESDIQKIWKMYQCTTTTKPCWN